MIRVLVVDDHPVLRAGLEAVLRTEPGFQCVGAAADGAALRRALRHTRPDVIVLDHRLGDEDGLELCLELASAPGAPAILLYTAAPTATLHTRALAAGAAGLVDKSVDVDTLFDAIRMAGRRSSATT